MVAPILDHDNISPLKDAVARYLERETKTSEPNCNTFGRNEDMFLGARLQLRRSFLSLENESPHDSLAPEEPPEGYDEHSNCIDPFYGAPLTRS